MEPSPPGASYPVGRSWKYTGGSTGTSLAFVCAALGYSITVVTSDAFSREKRDHMRALGANVVELPSDDGRTTKELIQRMIARAAELSAAPSSFYADQFANPDAAGGYAPLADELWEQAAGRLDAFVQFSRWGRRNASPASVARCARAAGTSASARWSRRSLRC